MNEIKQRQKLHVVSAHWHQCSVEYFRYTEHVQDELVNCSNTHSTLCCTVLHCTPLHCASYITLRVQFRAVCQAGIGAVKHTTDTCSRRTVLYTVRGIRAINYLYRDLCMHLYPKHENKGLLMEGDGRRCLVTGVPVPVHFNVTQLVHLLTGSQWGVTSGSKNDRCCTQLIASPLATYC